MNDSLKRTSLCLALAAAMPAAAFAQAQHGGGGQSGRAPAPAPQVAAPAPQVAAPARRPAPASQPAPASRPAGGGFNFNRDIGPAPARPAAPVPAAAPARAAAPPRAAAPQRVAPPERATAPDVRAPQPAPAAVPERGNQQQRTAYQPPANYHRAPFTPNQTGGPYRGRFGGRPIHNPRFDGGQYGWNNGVVWQPAPIYWGGGFWGPFALANLSASEPYGSVLEQQNYVYYPSYQVEPDTPGYDMLGDYGLQQTQCGPPGLVGIWGPDDSVVCAYPNDQVAAGNYEVDLATYTLLPVT